MSNQCTRKQITGNNRCLRVQLLAFVVLIVISILTVPTFAALPNQRTDLKVLLLSATGTEPATQAFEMLFKDEGVPYDKIVLTPSHTTLTAATFADTVDGIPRAKYQAVVVASGWLYYWNGSQYVSALTTDEWNALNNYEAVYGIRQITASTYPTPDFGLNYPTTSKDLGNTTAQLTAAGKTIFPYLKGPVPIDVGSWGSLSTPIDPTNFTTLLLDSTGTGALLGIFKHTDGREEMVGTVEQNGYQINNRLLRHGMLSWVTRGLFVGYQRNYFSMHVDDVFLDNDRWNFNTHSNNLVNTIRMTAADVTRAVNWQNTSGILLGFAYNGSGINEFGPSDRSIAALLANRGKFYWINHTFTHLIFDDKDEDPANGLQPATFIEIKNEIQNNINIAGTYKIPINKKELVTGGHSGLFNTNMPSALTSTGITWIGDDNSRRPAQWKVGPALTVPRHPTNIYYNTSTIAEQIDEYNYIYLPPSLGGVCVNTEVTTCFSERADWDTYVNREVSTMLLHITGNDPRPHYVHQSNLAGDGILYLVLNPLLNKYKSLYSTALTQPSLADAGTIMQRADAWNAAKSTNVLTAYLQNGQVILKSTKNITIPLTGTSLGTLYGNQRSGWQTISAGGTVVLQPSP